MYKEITPVNFDLDRAIKAVFRLTTPYVEFSSELIALNFRSTVLITHIPTAQNVETKPDHTALLQAAYNIGRSLKHCQDFKVVLLHYVSQPGSVSGLIGPILEQISGKTLGIDFGLAFNAQETLASDFSSQTIIGVSDDCTQSCLKAVLPVSTGDIEFTDLATAELIPYWRVSQSHAREALEAEMQKICDKTGADFTKLLSVSTAKPEQEKILHHDDDTGIESLNTLLHLIQDIETPCPLIESLRFSALATKAARS